MKDLTSNDYRINWAEMFFDNGGYLNYIGTPCRISCNAIIPSTNPENSSRGYASSYGLNKEDILAAMMQACLQAGIAIDLEKGIECASKYKEFTTETYPQDTL